MTALCNLLTTWPVFSTPGPGGKPGGPERLPTHMRWYQLQLAKLHNSLGCFQTFWFTGNTAANMLPCFPIFLKPCGWWKHRSFYCSNKNVEFRAGGCNFCSEKSWFFGNPTRWSFIKFFSNERLVNSYERHFLASFFPSDGYFLVVQAGNLGRKLISCWNRASFLYQRYVWNFSDCLAHVAFTHVHPFYVPKRNHFLLVLLGSSQGVWPVIFKASKTCERHIFATSWLAPMKFTNGGMQGASTIDLTVDPSFLFGLSKQANAKTAQKERSPYVILEFLDTHRHTLDSYTYMSVLYFFL